jgi:hypothetical protein
MHFRASAIALILAVGGAGACSSTRGESDARGKLAAARSALQKADTDGNFTGVARTDLDAARYYLQQAEAAKKKGEPQRDVDNLAYTAEQLATAAMARQESMRLQDKDARDRDAKMAQHKAETAELEAERTRLLTEPVK